MPCSYCSRPKVFARGYCQACYYRLRRNGTLVRKNVVSTGTCSLCEKEAFAKGLCSIHYAQADHPLKATWKLLRSRHRGEYPKTWDDFHKFLADVGPRPNALCQLRRVDATKPYSRKNVHWLQRVLSQADHERVKGWSLKSRFGLSLDDFKAMLKRQGGVCAICGKEELAVDPQKGRRKSLSVDHCHTTGRVRGLLCVSCNRGLGYFRDRPELLEAASAYLRR